MDKTKIKKSDLLEVLQENRAKHEKDYKSARKEWKKRCTKALRKALKRAESEKKVITLSLFDNLPRPRSYIKEYDRVIRRLEMEVDDVVELDAREFQSWVLDEWNWHGEFVGTTSLYTANVR